MSPKITDEGSVGSDSRDLSQRQIECPFPPKAPIKALYSARDTSDTETSVTDVIFTHGAGGTLQAEAIVNFVNGFLSLTTPRTILCFQGNMNLASRVKMFAALIKAEPGGLNGMITTSPTCLGGRSMGARAAVMAATEETTHLVLVSYPLHTSKETRDRILLDLPASVKVIFVSGANDDMCNLERLDTVRRKMNCTTWRISVEGANHGMNVKPKAGTQQVGEMTGALVATWLDGCDETLTEGSISWDLESSAAVWSGWSAAKDTKDPDQKSAAAEISEKSTKLPISPSSRKKMKRTQDRHNTDKMVQDLETEELEELKPKRRRRKQ